MKKHSVELKTLTKVLFGRQPHIFILYFRFDFHVTFSFIGLNSIIAFSYFVCEKKGAECVGWDGSGNRPSCRQDFANP